jgi:hypothetical protein
MFPHIFSYKNLLMPSSPKQCICYTNHVFLKQWHWVHEKHTFSFVIPYSCNTNYSLIWTWNFICNLKFQCSHVNVHYFWFHDDFQIYFSHNMSVIILKGNQIVTYEIRDKFHLCLSNLCNFPHLGRLGNLLWLWQTQVNFIPNFTRCHVITYANLKYQF